MRSVSNHFFRPIKLGLELRSAVKIWTRWCEPELRRLAEFLLRAGCRYPGSRNYHPDCEGPEIFLFINTWLLIQRIISAFDLNFIMENRKKNLFF